MFRLKSTFLTVILGFSAGISSQATPLLSATFTGQATGGSSFLGLERNDLVSGSVIFDSGLLVGHTTGYYNLSLQEPNSAFAISLGNALTFTLASDTSGTIGLPAIQFRNGNFNGFAYNSDFANAGQSYRFWISGGTWFINEFDTATGYLGRQMQTGWLNFSLVDLQPYTPPVSDVPEPATIMLVAAGLAGVCAIRRRQNPVSGS